MSKELDLGRVVGKDATINGQNAIQLIAGKDINISQEGGNVTVAVSDDLNAVPKERMINNKPLSEDITLNASDVGAVPTSRTINGKPLTENITLDKDDIGVQYGTTSPKMDGTAAVGTDTKLARADHVHPSDTSKQDKLTGTPDQYVTFDENGNAVAKRKDYSLFGFQINPDESDPSKIIKYIAQNASYDPAFMDYTKDEFNYGDWSDAWFIKNIKVVVLGYDGTIKYELNKNKYDQQANAPIDISIDSLTSGNVMVGIPTVWIRYAKVNGKDTFYFSDQKLSNEFKAYAHTAADGSIMPYTYLAAYNGYKDTNNKLRSLSGKTPTGDMIGTSQITAARANNPTGKNMWDIDTFTDRNLINLLLLLIGKSTDTQTTFGKGNMNGNDNPAEGTDSNGVLPTGTMNDKGLFWGSNADNLGVKVFGIENWWGNVYRRTQGLILDEGVYKVKLTYGTEDGSTIEGYNETGEGYINSGSSPNSGYIKSVKCSTTLILPETIAGSKTTYFCDYIFTTRQTGKYLSSFGGGVDGDVCGAFACHLNLPVSYSHWGFGAAVSCKPY